MRVALYGKCNDERDKKNVLELLSLLDDKNISISVEKKYYEKLKLEAPIHDTFSSPEELKKGYDFFLSMGGDGTLLKAAMYVLDSNIPVIGINTGRLGFLAGFQREYFMENIDKIFAGEYIVTRRSLIELKNINQPDLKHNFALNELAITRKETTSMITIKSYIGDKFLNSFWADGLIISTPTGSTGYSLSCGGPIISPENACFVVTPIAPHNLNVRPIVIPDSEKLKLIVESRASEYYLSLDSRFTSLPVEKKIILELATFKINLVQNNNQTYFETLRQKLLWGRDSRS